MNPKTVKLILNMFSVAKILLPVMGLIYFLTWVFLVANEDIFKILDKFFGFFPNILNELLDVTVDFMGQDILMGYIYAAIITVIIFAIVFKADMVFKDKTKNIDFAVSQPIKKPKQKVKSPIIKDKKQETKQPVQQDSKKATKTNKEQDINAFYGLLTFELKYIDDNPIDEETQKAIKHSYTKILVEKLKEKYGSVNYAVSDKVFFICNNISLFNLFVRDIVKLNKIISQISEKQNIKTALKVCFWSSPTATPKQACAILLRINQLNYLNKVIVSKQIQLKFDRQLIRCFNFCSMGTIKLVKLNPKDSDMEMELFYLKTMDD